MTTYAKLKVAGVVFDPKPASDAEEGELYTDSDSSQLSTKGTGSGTTPIGAAPGSGNQLIKTKQNLSGVTIPAGELVALLTDGSIALAGSDTAGRKNVIGAANVSIANNAMGVVGLLGPALAGVLTGLGFAPGDVVYMAESTGQYTNDIGSFSGGNDRIVRVGIADCADGAASATVVDLLCILTEDVVP